MARYQIILAYDGTEFFGSQKQKEKRTVQDTLESALCQVGWQGKSILLAGRTDTGTHASGQVAAFDLEWTHSPGELAGALNANLPLDVVVRNVQQVTDAFHPRFDAEARSYRYRLICQPVRDPLRERYAWRVWPEPDELNDVAALFLGCHDYAAFGSPSKQGGRTIRTVKKSCWQRSGDTWTYEIKADSFLYRMVRRIVYIQVHVGQGRISSDRVSDCLEDPQKGTGLLPSGLAPANGLTLFEIHYDH